MAFRDVIKFEDSFVSSGGISPATGTMNGHHETGKVGQGFKVARTGGALIYTPSDFGIDLNSNKWGFVVWAKPNKASLDSVGERHALMNVGTYYDLGESDVWIGFWSSTPGQRTLSTGVYENQVAKTGAGGYTFTDWTVQNWFLYGIFCDGTNLHRMCWNPADGFSENSNPISWNSTLYPMQDQLLIGGYDWDQDSWGGWIDELRFYDDIISKKEFIELARGLNYHYTFNTYEETLENEFYDNWDALVTNSSQLAAYGGPGTLQSGATDPFGSTDSSVFRKNGGLLRFGEIDGTDVGTIYDGSTYTFSIYLRKVYNQEPPTSIDFDIVDRTGTRSYSGDLANHLENNWKRFWTTATHDNNSNYHFIDVGKFGGTGVFEWCCPQIERMVGYNMHDGYDDPSMNISPFTNGRTGIVNDDSGNENNVTLTYNNSPYWTIDGSAEGRSSYIFPGNALKKITTSIDASARTQYLTMSCWAYQLNTSTQHGTGSITIQHIISQGRDVSPYGAYIYSSNGNIAARYGGSSSADTLSSGVTATTGWHHIAFVYDISVGGKLYVDGNLKDSGGSVGELDYANASSVFAIGKMAYSHTQTSLYFPFNGYIDDVRVFDAALDASAIREVMEQRASIDNVGNFHTNPLIETGHQPLILDYTGWTLGSGSSGDFVQNGGTAENERIISGDPFGNQGRIVWEARSDNVSGADGGWTHNQFDIDASYYYRYSTWVWRNSNSDGNSYMGLYGYGSVNGVLERDTGSNSTNPYWYTSESVPTAGRWELIIGHVFPAGSGTGGFHEDSGRYTIEDGNLGTTGMARDYVWREETTTARQRCYLFYSVDTSIRQQWIYPRVDKLDGTEPSIEDLLAGFDGNNYDYIDQKGGTNYVSLDVGKNETYIGNLTEASVTNDILLWYPLQGPYTPDGDAYEMVDGYDGTLTGDPSIMARGYYFDGTEDVDAGVGIDNIIGSTNASELSFSAWVNRRASINNYNMIMGQLQPWLAFRSSNLFQFSAIISGTQRTVSTDTSTYTDGVWYHVVGTYDGADLRIYVNGELEGTLGTYTGGITLNTSYNYFVGNWDGGSSYPHDGTISDARVYYRALTAEEIQILYKTTDPEGTNRSTLSKDTLYLKERLKET